MSTTVPLGRVLATPAALTYLRALGEEARTYLGRHAAGDYGMTSDEDAAANNAAIEGGRVYGRVMSSYRLDPSNDDGIGDLWVITEPIDTDEDDQPLAGTTVLLPSDY